MGVDERIRDLVEDARPVRRLPPPARRFPRWAAAAALCLAAGVALHGTRPDLAFVALDPAFLFPALAALAAASLAAAAALVISVPGHPSSRAAGALAAGAVAVWLLGLASGVAFGTGPARWDPGPGAGCVLDLATMGLIPGAILFVMAFRAAPLRRAWVGWLLAVALASSGSLATALTCRNDSPAHVLVWHFLPVLAAGALGAAAGRWVLRR
jgi:hypothetical protein